MPLESLLLTASACAAVGGVLGWWPLAAWVERSLRAPEGAPRRMSRQTVRVAACATAAACFGLIGLRFGDAWVLPALLAFAASATVLSFVDLMEHRLPNAVVFPSLALVAALCLVASPLSGRPIAFVWALVGSGAMFALYLLIALISPGAMGMGDVKLALLIGFVLGWFGLSAWVVGLLGAFVVGGVVSIVALAMRRVTLRGSIPFGPSMLVGALLAVLLVGDAPSRFGLATIG
ncbi:leader peptidase (prepilin peptidase)/N-methyltransferase [Agromyces terreus]|uniref:Leader peptidase (Prepilin peptidase)/N-methyltransferase n=1 Tax=Agromyces terreus TaxID=424795 RepID=A0A9X2H381_9MICO|nr:A24 family peptidase [Agromyces terreus]MCP2370007.1 leader peptidase (prepilin peptidase)/N-methyltransferase [Agromyces terreus]